jgi:DNA-binding protein H-NS
MAKSLDISELSGEDLFDLIEMVLDNLPPQDLVRVRELAEAKRLEKLEEAKNAVIAEMRGKLEGLGLTLDDVIPPRTEKRETRRPKRNARRAQLVKYRGTNGEAWSGRGRVPQWLQALEEAGHNRDEFLVHPEER